MPTTQDNDGKSAYSYILSAYSYIHTLIYLYILLYILAYSYIIYALLPTTQDNGVNAANRTKKFKVN